ncbi:NAD(P)H-binding protein [Kitasatospora viridis]|uniref:Uncharacterized protein YbjT (DUF2867 family) n=1 Tax=Kitasatospora viridis TaxID=281105 RepID=A0A561UJW0_9ACTN|nr:NAD(P)H-binding protein [Kitasatospora viridis]TWF99651.1 uncharacterized protein YbjT (DUF2867 family) [Kitasatospora viridis]
MTILVTGARGNLGGRLFRLLAQRGHAVRGSARAAAGGDGLVELDLTAPAEQAERALRGVEAVFLYPARGPVDGFLRAAGEAGVRHVVLLSSPAAYEAHEHDRALGLAHRAVERALDASGLGYTVLYPSWLATNAARDWAGSVGSTGTVEIAFPEAQFNPIHPDDVAAVAAELLTGRAHRARMQVLTGPRSMRLREVVAELGAALGRELRVEELSREQALERRAAWLPEPVLSALLDAAEAAVGVPAPVTNAVERITGRPARSFGEWAAANREPFEGLS